MRLERARHKPEGRTPDLDPEPGRAGHSRISWSGTTHGFPRNLKQHVDLGEGPAWTRCRINTIRTLAMDAVQQANSGHPGTPMALAPVAYCLWQNLLRFDPEDPIWPNRDRFVLSAGHASMLLYSLLHLTGVKAVNKDYETLGEPSVPLEDIKKFRQIAQQVPGPPRVPLDLGRRDDDRAARAGRRQLASAWPSAERWLAAHYNQPGFEDLIDFNVYAICGDGDMMEGISHEAASLAGHLKLSNLCWIYDNNHITIEGNTDLAFSEDVATRFMGYGWNVTRVGDANDLDMLERAFQTFLEHERPADPDHRRQPHRLGRAPQAGHPRRPRRAAGRGRGPADQAVLRLARGRQVPRPRRRLRPLPAGHRQARQGAARRLVRRSSRSTRRSTPTWPTSSTGCSTASSPTAGTRTCPPSRPTPRAWPRASSSGKVLNAIAKNVPWLIGGAADLAPSTKTRLTFDGRRRLRGRQLRRPQPPLRHPRARDGGHPQRHGRWSRSGRTARAS